MIPTVANRSVTIARSRRLIRTFTVWIVSLRSQIFSRHWSQWTKKTMMRCFHLMQAIKEIVRQVATVAALFRKWEWSLTSRLGSLSVLSRCLTWLRSQVVARLDVTPPGPLSTNWAGLDRILSWLFSLQMCASDRRSRRLSLWWTSNPRLMKGMFMCAIRRMATFMRLLSARISTNKCTTRTYQTN